MNNNAKYRVTLSLQARGSAGKSIEVAARASWLNQRGIAWQGFDLDGDNRTLSRLYPEHAELVPVIGQEKDQDPLASILRRAAGAPVTVIDSRAHLDDQWLKALHYTNFFKLAAEQNIGITILVFPRDDFFAISNVDSICQSCRDQVDYVIVRNPVCAPETKMFDGSEMEKELLSHGAATLTIPMLSETVKRELGLREDELGRGIPFDEAIGSDELGLDVIVRGQLQHWLAKLFSQYDHIAAKLLPAAEAAALKPKGPPPLGGPVRVQREAARINRSIRK
jgi:hypothetical protein